MSKPTPSAHAEAEDLQAALAAARIAPESVVEPAPPAATGPRTSPVDPVRMLLGLTRRWWWLPVGGLLLGIAGAAAGFALFDTIYQSGLSLIRREVPNTFRFSETGESFKPQELNARSMMSVMRSPRVFAAVAARTQPPISQRELSGSIELSQEKNSELIQVQLTSRTGAAGAADLANLYAQEVVYLVQSLQSEEASEFNRFLREQIAKIDLELDRVNQELITFTQEADFIDRDKETFAYLRELTDLEVRLESVRTEEETIDLRIAALEEALARQNPAATQLSAARRQLEELLIPFTESNPLVKNQRAKVQALEVALERGASDPDQTVGIAGTSIGQNLYLDLVGLQGRKLELGHELEKLAAFIERVSQRLDALPGKGLQYARIEARRTSLETMRSLQVSRQREIQLFEENAPGYYRVFSPATESEVITYGRKRKILLLGLLGGFFGCGLAAFLALAVELLDDRLVTRQDLARATRLLPLAGCGSGTDAHERTLWAQRSWTRLRTPLDEVAQPGTICGFVSAGADEGLAHWMDALAQPAAAAGNAVVLIYQDGLGPRPDSAPFETVLADPDRLTTDLQEGEIRRLHIDPGSEWTLARRRQLRVAVQTWQQVPNLVILLPLPAAEQAATSLLAPEFPALIWISTSGKNRASQVTEIMDTLREAGARFVGAGLHQEPDIYARFKRLNRFGLGVALALALLGFGHGSPARAAAAPEPGEPVRAAWQDRLTLGPGDHLDVSVYGRPELTRSDLTIGPDGRINYLHARDIPASGLTIDELRDRLNQALSQHYRNARVMVTPVSFQSKKYFLLGAVRDPGSYLLNQPTSLIEAVAQARGLTTGLFDRNTVELADLPRSFVVRDGERLPVDFKQLFQHGDLSMNIQLAPGDFVYIPSSSFNQVYVFGAVVRPGAVGVTANTTALSVITVRGGFTPEAFRKQVLVVRGSLENPETTIVNAADILSGRAKDFVLQPKDIVFVADRPWTAAGELLDLAAKAFMRAVVITWTGDNVGPIF